MSEKLSEELEALLKENLTIHLDTESPPYTGTIYLNVKVKYNDRVVAKGKTALPSRSDLKRAEYDDN